MKIFANVVRKMKPKILVIDDEEKLLRIINQMLSNAGFEVITATTGLEGIDKLEQYRPDLIILDLVLPDIDGLEVCKITRQSKTTRDIPIIMLTARGTLLDRISGLRSGADDYIVKPFNAQELIERVNVILRRSQLKMEGENELISKDIYVNISRHIVKVKNKEIKLTPKEFELLCLFLKRKNHLLTKASLLENIWGYDKVGEISTRRVERQVQSLRKKLGRAGEKIETVYGYGFKFVDNSS